jgi:epoxyqueuosine reductase
MPESDWEFGYADLRGVLSPSLQRYTAGISIVRKLDVGIIDEIVSGPTEAYFLHYSSINSELNEISQRVAAVARSAGFDAMALSPTALETDIETALAAELRAVHSHKMTAARAGLGWIGKTDLFISERFGPRVRLCTVLLDSVPDECGEPVTQSRCGNCRLCVDMCPAHVATGDLWHAGLARDAFFDAFKCRDYCRRICSELLGREISICGKCVSVCPVGR